MDTDMDFSMVTDSGGTGKYRVVVVTTIGAVFTSVWEPVDDEDYGDIMARIRCVLSGVGSDNAKEPHPSVYDIIVSDEPGRGRTVFIPSRSIVSITLEDGYDE